MQVVVLLNRKGKLCEMDENDYRLVTLADYLSERLTLKADLWSKMIAIDEYRVIRTETRKN